MHRVTSIHTDSDRDSAHRVHSSQTALNSNKELLESLKSPIKCSLNNDSDVNSQVN